MASSSSATNDIISNENVIDYYPTDDQAITLKLIDNLAIKQYYLAIGEIIQPINIIYFSYIPGKQICMYLRSKELVEKLVKEYKFIKIDEYEIEIKYFIIKTKSVIISNVYPIIPNDVIIYELFKLGIQSVSKIVAVKSSIGEKGYEHVLSFKREISLDSTDLNKLPLIMKVYYNGKFYFINFGENKKRFFSDEDPESEYSDKKKYITYSKKWPPRLNYIN